MRLSEQPVRGLVFNVQRFSLHDGPGIRTTVFLKGCPLRCWWCQNPESLRRAPEIAFYSDRCRQSGACRSACPHGALQSGSARVDRHRCEGCGSCVEHCPYGALQLVGRWRSATELCDELLRDHPFFDATGGGITLSGGEPTLQLGFVAALAEHCEQAGVSVGLQTCGAFRWQSAAPVLSRLSFVHFDLKIMDRQAHRRHTGVDNRTILANARRLVEAALPVTFRLAVIPDGTDDPANVDAVASFLRELGVGVLHLLPYHRMGEIKADRLGLVRPTVATSAAATATQRLARVAAQVRTRGIEPVTADP